MINSSYSLLLDHISDEETSRIAKILSANLRNFARRQYPLEFDAETRLSKLFGEVSRLTDQFRNYTAVNSHEILVSNWGKGRSKSLVIATYFYLGTQEQAQTIWCAINQEVFGVQTLKAAKGLALAELYEEKMRTMLGASNSGVRSTFSDSEGDGFPTVTVIEPGSFRVGSAQAEYDRDSFESPQYEVTIRKPFAIGIFAVTRAQYAEFAQADNHPAGVMHIWRDGDGWIESAENDWRTPGFKQNKYHPVVGVSHEDAVSYCKWLSDLTGETYRLPTEIEWEYACRAGTTTPFSWGDDITPGHARYDHREAYHEDGEVSEFLPGTAAVDAYDPNPWGLYQMHGNVWEWCSDPWIDNYRSRAAGQAARFPRDFNRAVVRGGAWLSIPNKLRSAKRDWDGRTLRGDTVGFRVVRELAG